MRILILTNSDSGLYQFRKELIEELLRQNNEVFIASPGAEYIPVFEQVGDNLTKDFQAPQQLGMKSIFFKNPDGLYSGHENSNLSIIRAITDFMI